MLYYGKNARKKTRRTVKQDKQGKVVGYPLFVRPDREILKTPPRGVPFWFIIFDELDSAKSLKIK